MIYIFKIKIFFHLQVTFPYTKLYHFFAKCVLFIILLLQLHLNAKKPPTNEIGGLLTIRHLYVDLIETISSTPARSNVCV
jgi:hypothetical protein